MQILFNISSANTNHFSNQNISNLLLNVCFCAYTAWHHIMAHTLYLHKTKVKIFNKNGSLSPTLVHYGLTNKEMEVTTEII